MRQKKRVVLKLIKGLKIFGPLDFTGFYNGWLNIQPP